MTLGTQLNVTSFILYDHDNVIWNELLVHFIDVVKVSWDFIIVNQDIGSTSLCESNNHATSALTVLKQSSKLENHIAETYKAQIRHKAR